MVVQLDKISNSSAQMQGSQQAAPARLPKGLSDAPSTLNFAPQQKSSKSFMDSVRAFFSAIWNFICCCRESKEEKAAASAKAKEAFQAQAVQKGKNMINAQLSESSLKCLTQSEARIGVVIFVNFKIVAALSGVVARDKVADFQKNAIDTMKFALSTYELKNRDVVTVHTAALEKSAKNGFNVNIWDNSSILSTSTPHETVSENSGGVSFGDGLSAKEAAGVIMSDFENNKDHPQTKALLKFFGEGLKS